MNYTRLKVEEFQYILYKIEPGISKADTNMRQAISAGAKLEATLRFLATGESYASLRFSTRISAPSLSTIIPMVCEEILHSLEDDYLKVREWVYIYIYIIC